MRRQRSAKRLGTRHDLHYFKQWTPWRKARALLAIALPALALLWVFGQDVMGGSHPASSGPLSRSHSFFANDCSACHARIVGGVRVGGFQQHASDAACVTCHAAPVHHPNQTFTPECASCHVEHKGAARLAVVSEANCTQCHANLKTTDGRVSVAAYVTSFNGDHPEFAALLSPHSDPGTIAFNHAVHLKGVRGPDGHQIQLECADCHRTSAEQGGHWRFAAASFTSPARGTDKAYMVPPTYQANCAGCHDLRFDAAIAEAAPHDKPEVVMAFLEKVYAGSQRSPVFRPARLIPGAHAGAETPTQHVEIASRLLFGKTCKQCHQMTFTESSALPTVAKPQTTQVWLPKGRFDHEAHRSFSCTSCHENTVSSEATADVLVPSITTCQSCHNGDPAQVGHAENRCFECHDYHDWKNKPAFKGSYDVQRLRNSRRN